VEDAALAFSARGWFSNANYSTKKGEFLLFINHRLVNSPAIKKALDAVYANYLPKGSSFFAYLALNIAPDRIDVNCHPTKFHVSFLNEEDIVAKVQGALTSVLLGANESRVYYTHVPFCIILSCALTSEPLVFNIRQTVLTGFATPVSAEPRSSSASIQTLYAGPAPRSRSSRAAGGGGEDDEDDTDEDEGGVDASGDSGDDADPDTKHRTRGGKNSADDFSFEEDSTPPFMSRAKLQKQASKSLASEAAPSKGRLDLSSTAASAPSAVTPRVYEHQLVRTDARSQTLHAFFARAPAGALAPPPCNPTAVPPRRAAPAECSKSPVEVEEWDPIRQRMRKRPAPVEGESRGPGGQTPVSMTVVLSTEEESNTPADSQNSGGGAPAARGINGSASTSDCCAHDESIEVFSLDPLGSAASSMPIPVSGGGDGTRPTVFWPESRTRLTSVQTLRREATDASHAGMPL
jgi:hypothetical protein